MSTSRILSTSFSPNPNSTSSIIIFSFPSITSLSSMNTEYVSLSLGKYHLYCVYAVCSEKNTGIHPASTESNVDRRVKESPGAWRQKVDFSITSSTFMGLWHLLSPLAHRTKTQRFEAWHCETMWSRTFAFCNPGRVPPTKEKRWGLARRRRWDCHVSVWARVLGWK